MTTAFQTALRFTPAPTLVRSQTASRITSCHSSVKTYASPRTADSSIDSTDLGEMMRSFVIPTLIRVFASTGMLFLSALPQHAIAQESASLPYMNTQLSPEQR